MSEPTPEELLAQTCADLGTFAQHLQEVLDSGLSPAVIWPQLILAFRQNFGELPPEVMAQAAPLMLGGVQ